MRVGVGGGVGVSSDMESKGAATPPQNTLHVSKTAMPQDSAPRVPLQGPDVYHWVVLEGGDV